MAIPTTGDITSDHVVNEFSVASYPLSSDICRDITDGTYPVNSDELRGLSGLSVSLAFTAMVGSAATISTSNITAFTTFANQANPTGGVAPYSYAWQKVSGTTLSVTNSTSASTTFQYTGSATSVSGVYRCRVTDSQGTVAYSPNCTITMYCFRLLEANLATSYLASAIDPNDATIELQVRRDGYFWRRYNGGSATQLSAWVTPNFSTVGDFFSMKWNNDSSVSGDNTNIGAFYPAENTTATINDTKYIRRNRTVIGSNTAGFKLSIGNYVYTVTYQFIKSSKLIASVSSDPVGMGIIGIIGVGGISTLIP